MICVVFKGVSPVNNVEVLSICLWNRKSTLKTRENLSDAFLDGGGEAHKCLRIRGLVSLCYVTNTSARRVPGGCQMCASVAGVFLKC